MPDTMSTIDLLAEQASWRSATYRNLSALFADAPSEEGLQALIAAASAIGEDDVRRESEEAFYAFLQELGRSDDDDLRRMIASEYAELFVGPRPPLAPLYESVYLGSPSRLFTEQTMSVRRFYERCGLSVVKDGKVPDDHMAYELELMSTLAQREAQALHEGAVEQAIELQRLQREFLVVHLGGWTGPFASRVAEAPCANFYGALSRFTHEFACEDDAFLAEAIRVLEAEGALSGQVAEVADAASGQRTEVATL